MIFIGMIGAASVLRLLILISGEIKYVCVGGNSNVPLVFSLTENIMMIEIALWMLVIRT